MRGRGVVRGGGGEREDEREDGQRWRGKKGKGGESK